MTDGQQRKVTRSHRLHWRDTLLLVGGVFGLTLRHPEADPCVGLFFSGERRDETRHLRVFRVNVGHGMARPIRSLFKRPKRSGPLWQPHGSGLRCRNLLSSAFDAAAGDFMTVHDVVSMDRQQAPLTTTKPPKEISGVALSSWRLRGALATGTVLLFLWAGFHWHEPASWTVGVPMALIGGALTLFLPASAPLRLSPLGGVRFLAFAAVGIVRGAVDVSRRSFSPQTLRPGCLLWRTHLPKGRPRRLFAVATTLLPGTLTARIEDDTFTIHALDLSDVTRTELAALEAHIADLYKLDPKG
ncbi:Na+/H+ antiporter subunit E [Loktanella salsilacus]|uniref:Na+/H+ antiporter subunit E n=1 Tax=Loktanella salsilacus TaxID=195913 RepID=UPI003704C9D3